MMYRLQLSEVSPSYQQSMDYETKFICLFYLCFPEYISLNTMTSSIKVGGNWAMPAETDSHLQLTGQTTPETMATAERKLEL